MVEGQENLVAALSPVSDSRILEVVIEVMTNIVYYKIKFITN